MASIKDVARLAGVSVSTVSRVLGGSERVDEDTKRKVERAIEAIDYRPNLLAQGLRSKSGCIIGLVVPQIEHETFAKSHTMYGERSHEHRVQSDDREHE
jgi:LacI family transcriptional regulator